MQREVVPADDVVMMECDMATNAEAAKLMKALEDKESLEKQVQELKKVNSEKEMLMRDLQRKIWVLKMKEVQERDSRIRDTIDYHKEKIILLRQGLEGFEKLEKVVAQSELEKMLKGLKLQCQVAAAWSTETLAKKKYELKEWAVRSTETLARKKSMLEDWAKKNMKMGFLESVLEVKMHPLVAIAVAAVASAALIYASKEKR